MRTDVNACTRGGTDTVRESALKADSERKIPRRTGESNLRQRRADPTLYQLGRLDSGSITQKLISGTDGVTDTDTNTESDRDRERQKNTGYERAGGNILLWYFRYIPFTRKGVGE